MKRNLNWKNVWKYSVIFWGVIFVVSLIPIILLSTYNFPCADDLGYSIYTRHAWVDTHNLFAVLGAAGRKVAESYQIWQGTWASIFLMALQPGIFGDGTYWIGTLMLLAALILSIYYFMKVFWGKWLGSSKTQRFIITFLFLFFGIQFMIDKTQGLFWYNGACHYIFPWSALLALAGIVVSMTVDSRHGKRKAIIGILLAVYIGGGNLVTGLECGIWLALGILLTVLCYKKKLMGQVLKIAVFWGISFGLNVAAPGNWVRQEEFSYRPGLIRSVLQSFYYCLDYVLGQWTDWKIILFVILIAPFAIHGVQKYKGNFSFRFPVLVPLWSYCVLASMFTESIYAGGGPGAGRIYNVIFLTYLILIMLNLVYLYGWYWKKYGSGKKVEEKDLLLWHIASAIGAIFCFLIIAGVTPDAFTSASAAKSLLNGEAQAYRAQEQERVAILEDASIENAELKEFQNKPYLLFYEDIEADTDNWKNVRMSSYYRKNSVILIESETE